MMMNYTPLKMIMFQLTRQPIRAEIEFHQFFRSLNQDKTNYTKAAFEYMESHKETGFESEFYNVVVHQYMARKYGIESIDRLKEVIANNHPVLEDYRQYDKTGCRLYIRMSPIDPMEARCIEYFDVPNKEKLDRLMHLLRFYGESSHEERYLEHRVKLLLDKLTLAMRNGLIRDEDYARLILLGQTPILTEYTKEGAVQAVKGLENAYMR